MNQKGGVGKTTTAINLAYQASLKFPTLLIDADPQGNASKNFEILEPKTSINDAFLKRDFEVVPVRENLDVLPSNDDFTGIDLKIQNELLRHLILKNALSKLHKNYEYIFIDCPPDLSLVTVNALSCADYVIMPVAADEFSMQGVEVMIDFIRQIKDAINNDLVVLGILLTHFDKRLTITKSILKVIEEKKWDSALFDTKIRVNTAIKNAQFHKKTIFEYDRKSTGALDYMLLAEEIHNKIKND